MSSQGSKFTMVPTSLWDWEDFTNLSPIAKIVWLAIYTTAETKRVVPGLFHGGVLVLAEAARMQPEDAMVGVEELLQANLVEVDKKNRIIRLTEFPEGSEKPANGDHIKGWWSRFRTVPACPVRDAHVRALRVLVDSTSCTAGIEAAWEETFGQIKVPCPRKRGVRSLSDTLANNDTSIQQHLFAPPPAPVAPVLEPLVVVSTSPVVTPLRPEPLPSAILGKVNDIDQSRHRVAHPTGHRQEEEKEEVVVSFPDSGSGDGGSGEGTIAAPTRGVHLALVPAPEPEVVTLEALLRAITGRQAHVVMPDVQTALLHAVSEAQHKGITTDDMKFVVLARAGVPPCGPEDAKQAMRWFSQVDHITEAIAVGRRVRQEQQNQIAEWQRSREQVLGAGWA